MVKPSIQVTDVKISLTKNPQLKNVYAYVQLTLNDAIVIRNAKLVNGKTGMFLAMPQRKIMPKVGSPVDVKAEYADVVFPCTKEARAVLVNAVMAQWEKVKNEEGIVA
jgi:stage V sporulation protein G